MYPPSSGLTFTENRKKDTRMRDKVVPDYISIVNTRKNPDMLMPRGKFLKGNTYFKEDYKEVEKIEEEGEVINEVDTDEIELPVNQGKSSIKKKARLESDEEMGDENEYDRLAS